MQNINQEGMSSAEQTLDSKKTVTYNSMNEQKETAAFTPVELLTIHKGHSQQRLFLFQSAILTFILS